MTWFSRVMLNPQRRGAQKLMGNPQAMHAAVMAAFAPGTFENSGTEGRVLWRLDSRHPEHTLYMVSPEEPDLQHVVEQAGWATSPADMADYSRFLNQLRLGQEWRFRLRANPIKSVKQGDGSRGKVLPHVTPAQQLDWLKHRSEKLGFELNNRSAEEETGVIDVAVTGRGDRRFSRRAEGGKANTVTLRQAQFDGTMTVTDVPALRGVLVNGVGRGKAYGCGLLTLRRP